MNLVFGLDRSRNVSIILYGDIEDGKRIYFLVVREGEFVCIGFSDVGLRIGLI